MSSFLGQGVVREEGESTAEVHDRTRYEVEVALLRLIVRDDGHVLSLKCKVAFLSGSSEVSVRSLESWDLGI